MSLTNWLYRLARASATGRAVRKGPGAYAKRQARKRVLREENKINRKLWKGWTK